MKRKHILLLSILLFQTFPAQGMEADNEEPHGIHHQASQPADDVALLRQEITHMREKFKQHAALLTNPDKVIIIGPSGSGKSTLIHCYAGIPLLAQEKEAGGFSINPGHLLPGFAISHGIHVGTQAPCPWYDQGSDCVYWDCPGFGDPRGAVKEIANSVSIHQLFKNPSSTRVILAISESKLEDDRSKGFKDLLNHIAEFFPITGELEKSLYLIVTKQDRIKPEIKLKLIHDDINSEREGSLTPRAKELLSFLVQNTSRITSFLYPRQEGGYQFNIRPTFLPPDLGANNLEVKIALASGARNLIEQLATELNTEICQRINSQIAAYVVESVKNHMGLARDLRNNLRHFFASFDGAPADPLLWSNFWYQKFYDDYVSTRIEDINFLKSIHNHKSVECNIDAWKQAIHAALGSFFDYSVDPQIIFEEGILKFTGSLIGTSDIQDARKHKPGLKSIETKAERKLFIDQDVRFSSIYLTLNALKWTVIDKKTIDISGLPGRKHNPPKAENGVEISNDNPDQFHKRNGKDGEKGLPGGHGGNFTGIGQDFENLERLTINISGGRGGKGQDGGDGVNGRDGEEGDIEEVRNRKASTLVEIEEVKEVSDERLALFNHDKNKFEKNADNVAYAANGRFKETYVSGMRGENGGEAGKRGEGGDGGQPGRALINDKPLQSDMCQDKQGAKGDVGVIGITGKNGKKGKVYKGVFIAEYVLSDLRIPAPKAAAPVNEGKKVPAPKAVFDLFLNSPKEGIKAAGLGFLGLASANSSSRWLEEPHEVEEEAIASVNEGQEIPALKAVASVNEEQKILPPKAVSQSMKEKRPLPQRPPVNEGQKILPPKAVPLVNAGKKNPAPRLSFQPRNDTQKDAN